MLLDNILLLIIIFFVSMFLVCYFKMKNKKEEFKNIFHITKPNNDQELSYNPEQIIVSNETDNYNDKDKYFGALHYRRELLLGEDTKLYVGNSLNSNTSIDYNFIDTVDKMEFPYIEENTSSGDRLKFNKSDDYLDADNLRVLKGQKLVPFYNKDIMNSHALKIVADRDSFENPGFKCGYFNEAQFKRGKITGIIPDGYEY